MLRGINHQIIEVVESDHPYFERALLFVRSAVASSETALLETEGRAYLKKAQAFSELRQARAMRWFKRCALVLFGGVGGMVLTLCLTEFL
ncbi:MAG: hypothetical protein IKV35_05720 [Clostridia bacterium]|nr:hypothetical protein [Clostridia bacterium]